MNYLKKIIDPLIEVAVHKQCEQLLEGYDSEYVDDEKNLERIQMERNMFMERMKDENEDMDMLRNELQKLDLIDQVLRYKMREKMILMDCQDLGIVMI